MRWSRGRYEWKAWKTIILYWSCANSYFVTAHDTSPVWPPSAYIYLLVAWNWTAGSASYVDCCCPCSCSATTASRDLFTIPLLTRYQLQRVLAFRQLGSPSADRRVEKFISTGNHCMHYIHIFGGWTVKQCVPESKWQAHNTQGDVLHCYINKSPCYSNVKANCQRQQGLPSLTMK